MRARQAGLAALALAAATLAAAGVGTAAGAGRAVRVGVVRAAGGSGGTGHVGVAGPARADTGEAGAAADTGEALAARDSALMPEGIPPDSLPDPSSAGAGLLVHYCSSCHGIPSPRRHAAGDWPATVRRMVLRMDMMARARSPMGGMMGRGHMGGGRMGGMMMGLRPPSAEQENVLLRYLESHAMPAADASRLPAHRGRALFEETCSRCHALPDPSQHTVGQWPAVVARMRSHMKQMGLSEITDSQAAEIVAYLRSARSALTKPPRGK